MGVSARLTGTTTGDGQDGVIGAPAVAGRPEITASDKFRHDTLFRDVRPDRVQVVTLSAFDGTDSFILRIRLADGGYVDSTSFVRLTNATAAAIQADLRTKTGDATLVVSGTTDAGPFTIEHTPAEFSDRPYPKYTVVGTGCTGVVTRDDDAAEADGAIGALGESKQVSESDTILKPTIGTITVTDSVDPVQTIDRGGATGGTFDIKVPNEITGDGLYVVSGVAYNESAANVQTAIRNAPGCAAVTVAAGTGDDLVVTFVNFGKPVPKLGIDDRTTGGTGVVVSTTTAGVLGSASIAYTENGTGDSVIAAAVNDSTGKSYGLVVDADTPVVIGGLPPGAYHAILRTVEDGRVSRADTKAFTVA